MHTQTNRYPLTANRYHKGQVILEFTFCLIVVLLLIYAVMKAFKWAGVDLVERRMAHDQGLTQTVPDNWHVRQVDGPLRQLDPEFYKAKKMGLIVNWDY